MKKLSKSVKWLISSLLMLLLFLVVGCLCTFIPNEVAFAEAEVTEVKYIFADPQELITDENKIMDNSKIPVYFDLTEPASFYLTNSYYLEVLETKNIGSETIYKVKYMGLDNLFVLKSSLDTLNIEPKSYVFNEGETPFPSDEYTKLTLVDNVTSIEINGTTLDNTYTFNYVGSDLENNYYVIATKDTEKVVGKVSKDNFVFDGLKINPMEVTPVEELPPPPYIPPTSHALRIVLILGIAIPAVLIVLIIFLPRKSGNNYDDNFMKSKKPHDDDYDRRDDNRDYDRQREYRDQDYYRNEYDRARDRYRERNDYYERDRDLDRDRDRDYSPRERDHAGSSYRDR